MATAVTGFMLSAFVSEDERALVDEPVPAFIAKEVPSSRYTATEAALKKARQDVRLRPFYRPPQTHDGERLSLGGAIGTTTDVGEGTNEGRGSATVASLLLKDRHRGPADLGPLEGSEGSGITTYEGQGGPTGDGPANSLISRATRGQQRRPIERCFPTTGSIEVVSRLGRSA